MAGLNLTAADAVLKDLYEGPVRKQINDNCKLTAQVTKNKKDFVGRRAVIPCHMTRNTGVGSRLEGEVLPQAGNQGTTVQYVQTKGHYGRMRLSRQVISQMGSDKGSFVRAVDFETQGLKADCARDYNRQLWGTSDGKIATCGTTSGSTTVQLATSTPEQVLVSIAEGMRIDIGTVSNPQSVASNRKVTSVDFDNKTIVIDGANVTTAGTDFIFRQGSGGSSASQRELTGVQSIVDDSGTLFSINPSTYWQWKSIVEGNSGTNRPISENLIAKAMHRAENRSGMTIDTLWCEDGVYRSFANLLQAQKRFVDTAQLQGGHKGLEVAAGGESTALVKDRDCPPNKLYGLNTESLCEYVNEDWQFESLDGDTLRLANDGTHAFEAIWFKFSEFATVRRNAHFLIEDLEAA